MKLIVIYITNNATAYGGAQPLRQVVLFVFVSSQTDSYENGVYVGSTYGGNTYAYGYDSTGYLTSIKQRRAETPYSQMIGYSYNGNSSFVDANQLETKTYANGDEEKYTYELNKTQVEHKNNNGLTEATYLYLHDEKGNITSQQHRNGVSVELSYTYSLPDNLEEKSILIEGMSYRTEYADYYDTMKNRVESARLYTVYLCYNSDSRNIDYTYNEEDQLSGMSYEDYVGQYGYDKLDRMTTRRTSSISSDVQYELYEYATYAEAGTAYTTNQLVKINDQTYSNNDRTSSYDEKGNITEIGYNDETYTYEYDSLGRLTKEDSTQYEYDNKNNLIKKTAGGVVTNYTYDNYNRLTSDGTNSYSYDAMGNPVRYKGNTFTWEQGRKLASGSMNGKTFSYSYDGNGMRYKKVVNGTTTEYYWNGSQLLMEYRGAERIDYIYDQTGIAGMIYGGAYYYFDKNTLGDIVAIRDDGGEVVAEYYYDAWGNLNDCWGEMASVNPFRYRGYYYDTETGFYYLQTRYYDPSIMRFINADNYELVAQLSCVPGQLNLYAYCNNNPVMYTDPTGLWIETALDVLSIVWSLCDFIANPSWANAGWLVLDVACACVPFLTGSSIIKSASKLDEVAYIGQGINRLDNMYDTVVLGNDMHRVMDRAMDIGATFYSGYAPLNALSSMHQMGQATNAMKLAAKLDNARFIIDKYNAGYKFVHVGSDGRGFFKMMSSAYGMELKILYRLKVGNKLHSLWWGLNLGRRIG